MSCKRVREVYDQLLVTHSLTESIFETYLDSVCHKDALLYQPELTGDPVVFGLVSKYGLKVPCYRWTSLELDKVREDARRREDESHGLALAPSSPLGPAVEGRRRRDSWLFLKSGKPGKIQPGENAGRDAAAGPDETRSSGPIARSPRRNFARSLNHYPLANLSKIYDPVHDPQQKATGASGEFRGVIFYVHDVNSHARHELLTVRAAASVRRRQLLTESQQRQAAISVKKDKIYFLKDSWLEQMLDAGFVVFAPDLQSHGLAQSPTLRRCDIHRFSDLTDDLLLWLETLAESGEIPLNVPVHLVGNCVGALALLRSVQTGFSQCRLFTLAGETGTARLIEDLARNTQGGDTEADASASLTETGRAATLNLGSQSPPDFVPATEGGGGGGGKGGGRKSGKSFGFDRHSLRHSFRKKGGERYDDEDGESGDGNGKGGASRLWAAPAAKSPKVEGKRIWLRIGGVVLLAPALGPDFPMRLRPEAAARGRGRGDSGGSGRRARFGCGWVCGGRDVCGRRAKNQVFLNFRGASAFVALNAANDPMVRQQPMGAYTVGEIVTTAQTVHKAVNEAPFSLAVLALHSSLDCYTDPLRTSKFVNLLPARDASNVVFNHSAHHLYREPGSAIVMDTLLNWMIIRTHVSDRQRVTGTAP